jgi:hypothetical protein
MEDNIAAANLKTLFNAHSILYAVDNDTPIPLTLDEQRILGRITGENIAGLTAAQGRTLLNVADGANNYAHPSAPPCRAATSGQTGHATSTQIGKLNGIAPGATADQTKADIDALNINADQVDGIEGADLLQKSVPAAGDAMIAGDWSEYSVSSALYIKKFDILLPPEYKSGVIRCKWNMRTTVGDECARGKVYLNGVATGTQKSNCAVAYAEYTDDINVSAGDSVQLYVNNEYSTESYFKEFKLCIA